MSGPEKRHNFEKEDIHASGLEQELGLTEGDDIIDHQHVDAFSEILIKLHPIVPTEPMEQYPRNLLDQAADIIDTFPDAPRYLLYVTPENLQHHMRRAPQAGYRGADDFLFLLAAAKYYHIENYRKGFEALTRAIQSEPDDKKAETILRDGIHPFTRSAILGDLEDPVPGKDREVTKAFIKVVQERFSSAQIKELFQESYASSVAQWDHFDLIATGIKDEDQIPEGAQEKMSESMDVWLTRCFHSGTRMSILRKSFAAKFQENKNIRRFWRHWCQKNRALLCEESSQTRAVFLLFWKNNVPKELQEYLDPPTLQATTATKDDVTFAIRPNRSLLPAKEKIKMRESLEKGGDLTKLEQRVHEIDRFLRENKSLITRYVEEFRKLSIAPPHYGEVTRMKSAAFSKIVTTDNPLFNTPHP